MAWSFTNLDYGWRIAAGITLAAATIYVANNTRQRVNQADVVELALGVTERCLAAGVEPPEIVGNWYSNSYVQVTITNGSGTNAVITTNWVTQCWTNKMTNAIGWRTDWEMMGDLDAKLEECVPYYVKSYTETSAPIFWTFTNLLDTLKIGDGVNFTAVPEWIGTNGATNAATYGTIPWRIYATNLVERYKVLNALTTTAPTVTWTGATVFVINNSNTPVAEYWRDYPEANPWPRSYGFGSYNPAAPITKPDCFGIGPPSSITYTPQSVLTDYPPNWTNSPSIDIAPLIQIDFTETGMYDLYGTNFEHRYTLIDNWTDSLSPGYGWEAGDGYFFYYSDFCWINNGSHYQRYYANGRRAFPSVNVNDMEPGVSCSVNVFTITNRYYSDAFGIAIPLFKAELNFNGSLTSRVYASGELVDATKYLPTNAITINYGEATYSYFETNYTEIIGEENPETYKYHYITEEYTFPNPTWTEDRDRLNTNAFIGTAVGIAEWTFLHCTNKFW